MVKRYSFKLFIRVAIFVSVFALYIINKDLIKEILNMKFTFGIINYGITPMHVIWLVFMVMMITLYVGIELQFSRQQCPHRRICVSGNTTVQPDSGLC